MENILPEQKKDIADMDSLLKQIDAFEHEQNLLLALGADITKVREKEDVIRLFSFRLRGVFYFLHSIIMLIDEKSNTLSPFVFDPDASPIKDHPQYSEIVNMAFPINAPVIKDVLSSESPVTVLLKDVIHLPGLPPFIKANYERGIEETMIMPLRRQDETIGLILVYSDRRDSFTTEFKEILQGIAPQLSSAISNILINEGNRKKDHQNEVLRNLSNEIANAKTHSELVNAVDLSLARLISFTHSLMIVQSPDKETYQVILPDHKARQWQFPGCDEVVLNSYQINDGICDLAIGKDKTVIVDIRSLDLSNAPRWLKLCYSAGAREILIRILPDDGGNRHGLILFADQLNTFSDSTAEIIDNIAGQLSRAAYNIIAHKAIMEKERDKATLLKFGSDLTAARTRDDLEAAIDKAFKRLVGIKLCLIRVIEDDGVSLSRYIYNKNADYPDHGSFVELAPKTITINEPLAQRSLTNDKPIVFDIQEELERGRYEDAMRFWKPAGLKNAFGARLRVGNENVGTLWLLTDQLNFDLLKGLCSQISVAIFNIRANERLLAYKRQLEVDNDELKEQVKTIHNFSEIIGRGSQMEKVFRLMSRVSESNSTVLILGETGTGKELIARGIHKASTRKDKLMIKVNCAALPPNLIESELFGHEKGAFTGATDRRIGKFELAHNSTIFLDEVGELPLDLQAKLLRVLQEREFERVGGKVTIKVDVRIIAATNRNLEKESLSGRFRADLYYRLNVFPIELPPLRERAEDIGVLANFFLEKYSKLNEIRVTSIAPKVMQQLKAYLWPGNVRELEHVMERSILLSNGPVLREVHLPKNGQSDQSCGSLYSQTIEELERSHIINTLKYCQGKISGCGGASGILDILPTTLHSKMSKLGITKTDYL